MGALTRHLVEHDFSRPSYAVTLRRVAYLEAAWALGIRMLSSGPWAIAHTLSLAGLNLGHGLMSALLLRHLYINDRYWVRRFWVALTAGKLILLCFFSQGFAVGWAIAVFTPWLFRPLLIRHQNKKVLYGETLKHPSDVQRYYNKNRPKHDRGLPFGTVDMPTAEGCKHTLTCAVIGAGKSITQGMLIRRITPQIWDGSDKRMVIFDPSHDMMSKLVTLPLACDVICLLPFDKRHTSIDLARDVTDLPAAAALADILVPSEIHSNSPFFRDAVATVIEGIIVFLNYNCPGGWRFRDVLNIALDISLAKRLLASDPRTARYADLGDPKTEANVRATVGVKLRPYIPIAAAWEHAEHSISLVDFAKHQSTILVLGESETSRGAVRALNRFILTRLSQLLLSDPNSYEEPRTYILLDEFPSLGNFQLSPDDNPLKELFTKGRKRGVSLNIVFQDISDMWAVHGRELTETIVSNCFHKAFLRLEGIETAEWAERLFGQIEVVRMTVSRPINRLPRLLRLPSLEQESESEHITNEPLVPASAFRQLQMPSKERRQGLEGYFISTHRYRASMSSQEISDNFLYADPTVPGVDPVPSEWFELEPLTQADYKRLNITHLMDDDDSAAGASPRQPLLPPSGPLPVLEALRAELEQQRSHQDTDSEV
ncbi:MAG: type IV secretion system DNA-binding domain-containing protein [Cyanobacteria bacterium P01_C01_bin.121]